VTAPGDSVMRAVSLARPVDVAGLVTRLGDGSGRSFGIRRRGSDGSRSGNSPLGAVSYAVLRHQRNPGGAVVLLAPSTVSWAEGQQTSVA
jgi:hypothetical protein